MFSKTKSKLSVFLSVALCVSMMAGVGSTVFAASPSTSKKVITVENINGISRQLDSELGSIDSEEDFNYILDELNITVNNNAARVETEIEGNMVEFSPILYQSKLGYNSENTIFGVSSDASAGYKLTKFTIENNAGTSSLMTPNLDMAGNTVVSLAFLNEESDELYYFQLIANDLVTPANLDTETDITDYELANFSARPYELVKADIESLNAEIKDTSDTVEFDEFSLNSNVSPESSFDLLVESEESKMFDELLIESKNGPISLQPRTRVLVPNIPDYVYKSQTYGWETVNNPYINEGSNAKRANGYVIYHMPDSFSGNAMNYVMRFESIFYYNSSSQTYKSTFRVTHNLWVQYIATQNSVAIFDDRNWNARLDASVTTSLETPLENNGYFPYFRIDSVSHGSIMENIVRSILTWVPYLGDFVTSYDEFTSGNQIKTGTEWPTNCFTKDFKMSMDNLKYPQDYLTLTGTGSGLRSVTGGYEFQVFAN